MGSDAFWARAQEDIAGARRRLYVQAMSFEGDAAGRRVAAAIVASPARDRRVLVDAYSTVVISDRFVLSPAGLFDRALRAEAKATRAMFDDLVRAGARVRVTNPVGPLYVHYPARNHKKLIVADEVAYIGGINFSDHNFAWHDFMLRLEGDAAARFLAEDFLATFESVRRPRREDIGDLRLYCLDGRGNHQGFDEIIALIEAATREITVISPYLTFPFTDALARVAQRGVTVTLITPLANNKPVVRRYLLAAAARAGFDVRLLPKMSHLKGLLIDDRTPGGRLLKLRLRERGGGGGADGGRRQAGGDRRLPAADHRARLAGTPCPPAPIACAIRWTGQRVGVEDCRQGGARGAPLTPHRARLDSLDPGLWHVHASDGMRAMAWLTKAITSGPNGRAAATSGLAKDSFQT